MLIYLKLKQWQNSHECLRCEIYDDFYDLFISSICIAMGHYKDSAYVFYYLVKYNIL